MNKIEKAKICVFNGSKKGGTKKEKSFAKKIRQQKDQLHVAGGSSAEWLFGWLLSRKLGTLISESVAHACVRVSMYVHI